MMKSFFPDSGVYMSATATELVCILSLYHGEEEHEDIMTVGNEEIIATSVKLWPCLKRLEAWLMKL